MDETSLTSIQICEVFDVWEIDFTSPFPYPHSYKYILVMVEYISIWVEAIPSSKYDARVVCDFCRIILLSLVYHES